MLGGAPKLRKTILGIVRPPLGEMSGPLLISRDIFQNTYF